MQHELCLDHLVFRVRDLAATRAFYVKLLGQPAYQNDDSAMFMAGDTRLFFTVCTAEVISNYDKEQPGLNHLAFGIREPAALREILDRLNSVGLQNSGIKIDRYGNKEFIWLDDPDGFRLEFYCRPA